MTLSEATVFFKQAFKYGAIGLAAVIVLWLVSSFAISFWNRANPPKETPTVSFGSIPKPLLPKTTTNGLSFVLDTLDGKLPALPTVLPVYQFATESPNLLDSDRAKTLAAQFGFTAAPQILDAQNYLYTDPKIPETLKVNIVSKNFSLTPNFSDPSIPKNAPIDSVDSLISAARGDLKSHNLLQSDLEKSDAKVSYKKISGTALVDASSISQSNVARVDIFRDGVAGYPIVGPFMDQALVSLFYSSAQSQTNLIGMNYTYWPYFIDGSATYPLLSTQDAWNALTSGQGVLVAPTAPNFKDVRIRQITIAYSESDTYQPYLQPIFLFDGVSVPQTGSEVPVRIYLPAINPTYFSK